MDRITLDHFEVSCVVGILDWERTTPQPVGIEVTLALDLDGAAAGDLALSIDYAAVMHQLTALCQGRWRLLESLGAAACRLLLAPPGPEPRAAVQAVTVRLSKPKVLDGKAIPSVTLHRERAWLVLPTRIVAHRVWADVLQETPRRGAYRLHLDPAASWRVPERAVLHPLHGDLEVVDGVARNVGAGAATLLVAGVLLPGLASAA